MSITTILKQDSKEVSATLKVSQIAELVSSVRSSYGNSDADIKAPSVNTTEGYVDLKFASDETKLFLIEREVSLIKIEAIEACKCNTAKVLSKVIEELVATSPTLVNISDTTDFTCL